MLLGTTRIRNLKYLVIGGLLPPEERRAREDIGNRQHKRAEF